MADVENANPKNDSTLQNIVGRTVAGVILEKIARGRQPAIKITPLSQIAWVGVIIVVQSPNEMGVRSFLCYIIVVLN